MDEPYVPKVNDYVIWDRGEYGRDEGWVYFYSEEYITIETGIKPKPKDDYCKNPLHKSFLCSRSKLHKLVTPTSKFFINKFTYFTTLF